MEFINFYFTHSTNRIRFWSTIFYLISVVLITQLITGFFGLHYQHPKEITLAVAIEFILSGEMILPVSIFCSYLAIGYLAGNLIYSKLFQLYLFLFRKRHSSTQKSLDIRKKMVDKRWIVFSADRVEKGADFEGFEKEMKFYFYDDVNVFSLYRNLAALGFNISVLLSFTKSGNALTWFVFSLATLITIFSILVVLAFMLERLYLPFYEAYLNHLKNPTLYKEYPPLYFTPEILKRKN